jgi:uncharacterized membrane protein YcaP (DUF421 family)
MFFDSWSALWRTVVVGIAAYAALVLLLRISGKRTLAKLNAFDLIVTVALGSTLATVLLDKSVSLSDSLAAFLLLVGLQYVVAFLSVRSNRIDSLVKSEPSLLLLRGEFLDRTMRRQRVTHREILAALRSSGVANVEDAYAVVLESDVDLTYTSNAIEGNSLTLGETAEVIEHGVTVGGKSLRDHLEAVDHYDAVLWMRALAGSATPVDDAVVCELHRRIVARSQPKIAGV